VKAILNAETRRVRGRKVVFYLVDWEGEWDPTWEPEGNVGAGAKAEYWQRKHQLEALVESEVEAAEPHTSEAGVESDPDTLFVTDKGGKERSAGGVGPSAGASAEAPARERAEEGEGDGDDDVFGQEW